MASEPGVLSFSTRINLGLFPFHDFDLFQISLVALEILYLTMSVFSIWMRWTLSPCVHVCAWVCMCVCVWVGASECVWVSVSKHRCVRVCEFEREEREEKFVFHSMMSWVVANDESISWWSSSLSRIFLTLQQAQTCHWSSSGLMVFEPRAYFEPGSSLSLWM